MSFSAPYTPLHPVLYQLPIHSWHLPSPAGKQFKVTADDVVFVNHLAEVEVNEVLSLDRVLLVSGGAPHLHGPGKGIYMLCQG